MKMIFAMLHSEDVDETVEELNKEKYWVTKLSTTGGFLKNKNVTLVIGTEDEQVPGALKILKDAQVRVSPSNIRCPLCRPEVLALAQTR